MLMDGHVSHQLTFNLKIRLARQWHIYWLPKENWLTSVLSFDCRIFINQRVSHLSTGRIMINVLPLTVTIAFPVLKLHWLGHVHNYIYIHCRILSKSVVYCRTVSYIVVLCRTLSYNVVHSLVCQIWIHTKTKWINSPVPCILLPINTFCLFCVISIDWII